MRRRGHRLLLLLRGLLLGLRLRFGLPFGFLVGFGFRVQRLGEVPARLVELGCHVVPRVDGGFRIELAGLASINGLALTSRSTLPASVRVRFVALSALVESRSDSLMDRPARLDRMSLPFDATRSRSESTSLSSTPALSALPTVVFALPLHAASWLMDACTRS